MLTNYFTLRALVREWRPALEGAVVGDAFSQSRDELTLAFATPDAESMLRLSVRAPFHFLFRVEGYSKARRNVATLFEDALDRRVTGLRLAVRDRMLFLDLDDGGAFQVMLFGPRANVFLLDEAGLVREAFQADGEWAGAAAPTPRPAPEVHTYDDFAARWRTDRKTTEQALASALPLFDRLLAAEALHRAGVTAPKPAAVTEAERRAVFDAAVALRADLDAPQPRVYQRGRFAEAFTLVPMAHLAADHTEEAFETVEAAVQVFTRRSLGQAHFREAYRPLEKALRQAANHYHTAAERMLDELARPSRGDRYERWGHLLMAAPADVPPGADEAVLPDLFAEGVPVTIPLDPARSAIENAERYYAKARQTRQSRLHAEGRLDDTVARAEEATALLEALEAFHSVRDLERFRKKEAKRLARYEGTEAQGEVGLPFRRIPLGEGYEVWVGKNAKQNDALTFHHARKHDLWMHARGVPGSHAVLRIPNRQATPPRPIVERAAAVAAYYSKARGSSLVPVIVVPRKWVRKPRGAAPGAVVVEREEVVLVEPRA